MDLPPVPDFTRQAELLARAVRLLTSEADAARLVATDLAAAFRDGRLQAMTLAGWLITPGNEPIDPRDVPELLSWSVVRLPPFALSDPPPDLSVFRNSGIPEVRNLGDGK